MSKEEHHHSPHPHPVTLANATAHEMSKVEHLKHASQGLFYVQVPNSGRHTFASEIEALSAREAETISEQAKEISKTFGIYKQRVRNESGKKVGEFIFMVRVKNPAGGELTREQWLALDDACDRYGDGSLRLTSRQGIQFHYVQGENLHGLVHHLNANYRNLGYQLTTLGACGDVNRNTTASPIDDLDRETAAGFALAGASGSGRAGAADLGLLPGVSLRRSRASGRADQFGRTDLRAQLPAAQIQDRLCASARQQRRSAHQ